MSRRDSEEKKFDENESDDVLDYLNDNVYGIGDTNIVNNDTKEIEKKTFQSWDDILEIPPLPYNKLIDLEWCNAYLSRGETETPKVETNPDHLDNAYMMNLANFTSNRTVANDEIMTSDSPTEYMASEGFVICPETLYDTFGAVLFDMNFDVKMDEL